VVPEEPDDEEGDVVSEEPDHEEELEESSAMARPSARRRKRYKDAPAPAEQGNLPFAPAA